jgi:TolA-binding protein
VKYQFRSAPFCVGFSLMVILLTGSFSRVGAVGTGGYDAPYFQADFTQDITEWSSPLINPALMYRVNQMHFNLLSIYRWAFFEDNSLGYQHVAALFPLRRNHTLGLTLLGGGSFVHRTTIDPDDGTIVVGSNTHFQDVWPIINYSYRIRPELSLGANVKMRIQNQFDEFRVSTPGIDLGAYYNPLDHYRFGDLGLSLSVIDLVPTQIRWMDSIQATEVTTNRFRVGIRYSVFNDNLVIGAEYLIDNLLAKLFEATNWTGYTDMFRVESIDSTGRKVIKGALNIAHRGGFHVKYMFIPSLWLKGGWTNNNIPYLGFNYNLMFPLPEMINYLSADVHFGYSFVESLLKESNNRDERGFTGAGKISIDFGPTREQRESKRLYDKLILAPMDAYNEAMRLYVAGKYWEASFAFGKVLSLFPNFHLNDKATWFLGNCYRNLYMNDIARQVYKQALEDYTTSETRSKYLYGLEALDYREGNYEEALKNHAFIINLYGESDIRPDADYLAGQIHFQQKNYNVAEQLLGSIPVGDPNYLYAQYTLAIINIENNKEQAAVQNLTYIINDTTQVVSDQLLQDGANTKLGHLYYEMGDQLRKAVESYQRVPVGSSFGDEALLGTAWAWIKVNQPNVALQTVEKLIASYGESPLVPEAFLVKGYALMLLRRSAEAVSSLEQCIAACKRTYVTSEDLAVKKGSFEEYTKQFAPVADRIRKNALRKPTNKTLEERPELQKNFEGFAKESKDYFNYTLLAKSHSRFFMRKDEMLTDAEYALAKATRMANLSKETKVIEDHRKQEGKIDQKLEDLKKELDQMNESAPVDPSDEEPNELLNEGQ